jgi:hypothetical protein
VPENEFPELILLTPSETMMPPREEW